MISASRRILLGLSTVMLTAALPAIAQPEMPKITKESIPGVRSLKASQLNGTVIAAEGNHLAVKMSSGELRTFDVPATRRFIVDGRQLTVGELQPGTKLTAAITTTTTSITERTTTIGTGTVWLVSGNTVVVTLPNGENQMYQVNDNYRFTVEGAPATVHDLRKGMVISAQKIVEEPRTEIVSDTVVTGEGPGKATAARKK